MVRFAELFSIAIESLFAHKLRSLLTMLGIIIGVGAVITLMSVGRGTQAMISSTFEELGTNILYVQPRNPDAPGAAAMSPGYITPTLTLDDAEAIAGIRSVIGVAPTNENFVELTTSNEAITSVIEGTTPEFAEAFKYEIAYGNFISERNVTSRDMVVVLGSEVAEELFGDKDPTGEKVKIKGKRFTVIGVLMPKGGGFFGYSLDEIVAVPITTFQSRLFTQRTSGGDDAVQSIAVMASTSDVIDEIIADIESVLRKRHHIADDEKDDFSILSQEQVLGIFNQIIGVLTIFLGAIAGISLLVGSIGIMNIMLVSVTERTREIGIRKAVGAKRRDIIVQFLLEAAMLSLVGGAIGITGGWLLSFLISQIEAGDFQLQAVVTPDIVILAISVSFIVGIASGLYPAIRAARLNPIDALRYQ